MFNQLADWLDSRTGYRALMHEALEEPIPGGARWKYVFGSALTSTFMIQLVTGLLLMLSYSPSSSTAWGSVFFISYKMDMGWFIRGIHHFGSTAMVILLALAPDPGAGGRRLPRPREVNWWFGMALLFITLGFSLTGYLLPWDQKGYWATKVATNIAGGAPVLGPFLQKLVVGGTEYGNQTLTRFYGLHVGVLPTLLVLCMAAHIALFRKHGITAPRKAQGMGKFWPEQVFMDTVASVAVLGVLVFLVVAEGGANLDAPADPSSANYPARPEWYFLSLFQMLKYFPGEYEVVGSIAIPTAILVVLLLLPLLDRVMPSRLAHFLACAFVFALVGGAGYLTVEAWREDGANQKFLADRAEADVARKRAIELAKDEKVGIPPDGAAYVLLRDPLYHGRAVLGRKCLGCHVYDGKGDGEQSAADLKDFGSRGWIRGLLENPQASAYFGKVPQCDGMAEWKKNTKLTPKQLDDVADFVATFARIAPGTTPQEWLEDPKVAEHPGLEPYQADCAKCHITAGAERGRGGDARCAESLRLGIAAVDRPDDPQAGRPDLYGYLDKKHQMPSFADQLTGNDTETLIRYLRNDYPGATFPSEAAPKTAVAKAAAR